MRIGFVGLGSMGEGMALNLVKAGFALTVFDLRADAVGRLVAAGAGSAPSVRSLAEQSDVVMVAVFDEAQLRSVCLGDESGDGLIGGLAPGATIVVHSTVSPAVLHDLDAQAKERDIVLIDAPMTGGGDVGARAGRLTFFVGGPASGVDSVRPLLEAMGVNVFPVGELGRGAVVKIINNYFNVCHVAVVREALELARRHGIEEDALLTMINAGETSTSWMTLNWDRIRRSEQAHTMGKAGTVGMARKDMGFAAGLADASGVQLPVMRAVLDEVLPHLDESGLTG